MNLDKLVAGLAPSKKMYWEDMYAQRASSSVLRVEREGSSAYVMLAESIAYPQGGDQLGDRGLLRTATGSIELDKVLLRQGVIIHYGKSLSGSIESGQEATIELDWPYRYRNMRRHTLGHLIASSLWQVRPEVRVLDSKMEDPSWLLIDHPLSDEELRQISHRVETAITTHRTVEPRFFDLEELQRHCSHLPPKLPAKNLRAVFIDGFEAIPCGGTHVRSTDEIQGFHLLSIEPAGPDTYRLYFSLAEAAAATPSSRESHDLEPTVGAARTS